MKFTVRCTGFAAILVLGAIIAEKVQPTGMLCIGQLVKIVKGIDEVH